MNQSKLRIWELALMVVMGALLLALAVGGSQQREISRQVLRLHILANSDSDEDQALKLKVRDGVLARAEELIANVSDRQEAEQILSQHLEELNAAGEAVVRAEGYDYSVQAQIADCYFPTREYDDFALPAGWYRALRMEIGEGAGQNWWCVVYPALCSAGVTEVEEASLSLGEESVAFITQESTQYVLRFQCAEWWGQFTGWLSGQ